MTNKFKFFKKKLAFLLFGIFLCVAVFGQSVTKEFIRTPLSNVLKEIERQTGLSFVYDRKDLSDAKLITQTFKDTPVEKVLSAILDENMDFSIRNKMVMIHKKEKTPQQRAMKTVSGTVADANGEPIIGASIAIKGDKTGTVTDVDGKFSIQAAAGSILAVSYIGYAPQEIRLGENANLQIVLLEDLRQLGEVVVVGYGTQKKSDITGSVSSVKTSEIQSAPSVNTAQALQGRAAGIMVQNMSGYPAGDVVIRIRGANSLTYGNDPLIIIDGVQGATLENLNPNDIQSAEILKDAAALSVYGSRGANGVILITTKNGKKGSPQFAYNFFTSFDKVRRTLPT
ncbi:MAG: carboxypeptidase-like regulatory domain-containing protein, partial [Dysgonamonadaceae bacterium]|nr:carboxypeptidase-like regulatory domain-containing protein [Dysgonamonadaceae bacterium]